MNIQDQFNYSVEVPSTITRYQQYRTYSVRRFNERPTTERGYFYPTVSETKSTREMVPVKYAKPCYVDYPTYYGAIDPIVASYWQLNRP
jgi:hypothetical protein